jgi:hypothetical protein
MGTNETNETVFLTTRGSREDNARAPKPEPPLARRSFLNLFLLPAAQPLDLVLAQRDACKDQSLLPLLRWLAGECAPNSVIRIVCFVYFWQVDSACSQ